MRPLLRVLPLLAVLLSACAGPAMLIAGESVRQPEPPPPILRVLVLAADDGGPLAAEVTLDGAIMAPDGEGQVAGVWPERLAAVGVATAGFHPQSLVLEELPPDGPLQITLDPVVLDGRVVGANGRGLPGATVTQADSEVVTDEEGRFRLNRAVAGELAVSRPAWEPATAAWDGAATEFEIQLEPKMIRALRVGGPVAGNPSQWAELLELADQSAVNAFVVDTKNEDGTVFHNTEVGTAHEISAVKAFYDLDAVIADMDAHELYKITRIVTFQDSPMAIARPEIAAWDVTTDAPWANRKGNRWLDPTDRESWEYPLDLAQEACRRGFDEIQFDYIRFPSDGDISTLEFDLPYTEEVRIETITAFLEEAHRRINPMGCAVAADIFAITLESSTDEGIGQVPANLSHHADVLSPMIYTYTYGPGWKGYGDPNDYPLEIVTGALDNGMEKIEGTSIVRPWIQTWLLDASEMRQVQRAVEERDSGWMIWSANTLYAPSMLPPPDDGG